MNGSRSSPKRVISAQGWSQPVSDVEAHRRAGGRRRYNKERQRRAWARALEVERLMVELDRAGQHKRGRQARIARALGVSEATVSRNLAARLDLWRRLSEALDNSPEWQEGLARAELARQLRAAVYNMGLYLAEVRGSSR